MDFQHPESLLLLWALPFLLGLLVYQHRSRAKNWKQIASSRFSELLTHRWRPQRAWSKMLCLVLAWTFLVFALARPRWGFEWKDVPKGGIDLMVALDLSTSMLATDISPSRLERSKREMIDLLSLLQGDRIGIVAFAGEAFVQCPLTQDYRMAKMFISQLDVNLMPVQGTAVGSAIKKSIDSLEKASPEESQGKAILLITDGEDHGTNPLEMAKLAKEKGIRIFAIGIGSEEGAPIPLEKGGFKKDAAGNVIVSRLDAKTLEEIATLTGAQYLRSTTGSFELETIYKKGIRGELPDQAYGTTRQKIWYERFPWFLLVALFFLFLEVAMREFVRPRRRKNGAVLGWFFLPLLVFSFSERGQAGSAGEGLYQKKEYEKAVEAFQKEEGKNPEDLVATYNRAVSQFRAGKFEGALEGFAKAAQSKDPQLQIKSQFNLGNTLVTTGKLKEAAAAYEQVLQLSPQDKDAKENLEWVQRKLKEEEEKKKDDKKDENKKDDKKDEKQEQDKKEDKQEQDKKDENKKDDKKEDKQDDKKEDKQEQDKSDKKDENKKDESGEEKKEPPKDSAPEPAPETPEQLDRKAAERLLRSVEAEEEVLGVPFKAEASPSAAPKQDW